MNEEDVQKQLKHMMAFIEQEAIEKAEEIDAKAEEEFNIEKGRLVQQQRTKIMEYYEKKEKQVELQRKIQSSNMLNQARLRVLKAQEDYVRVLLDEARQQLANLAKNPNQYPQILKDLIVQGLLQLVEKNVRLRCKQEDLSLVQQILPRAVDEVWGKVNEKYQVEIDMQTFLPSHMAGGVHLLTPDGKITVQSTLETRLDLISQKMIPKIRTSLFGKNPNRKHMD